MQVFRVENDDCEGPFTFSTDRISADTNHPDNATHLAHWLQLMHIYNMFSEKFPTINTDNVYRNMGGRQYLAEEVAIGCDSMQQLAFWFYDPRIIEVLFNLGFHISEYTVPDENCTYGDSLKQVGFLFFGGWRKWYPKATHDIFSLRPYFTSV